MLSMVCRLALESTGHGPLGVLAGLGPTFATPLWRANPMLAMLCYAMFDFGDCTGARSSIIEAVVLEIAVSPQRFANAMLCSISGTPNVGNSIIAAVRAIEI